MPRIKIEGLHDKGGKGVEKGVWVDIREIPVHAEEDFDELFGVYELDAENQNKLGGKMPIGLAKIYAARYGLRSMEVDGAEQELDSRNPFQGMPNLRDPKTRESIGTKVIEKIVERNDWLGYVNPYSSVFGRFLPPEPEEDGGSGPEGRQEASVGSRAPAPAIGQTSVGQAPADPTTDGSTTSSSNPFDPPEEPSTPTFEPGSERITVPAEG